MSTTLNQEPQPWEGILIATLAGASTILGGMSLFLVRRFKPIPFSICLSLAGGVMTYVTMVEMIPESIEGCVEGFIAIEAKKAMPRPEKISTALGWLVGTLCVFLGWTLGWFISWSLDKCLDSCNLVGDLKFDLDGRLHKEHELTKQRSGSSDRSVLSSIESESHSESEDGEDGEATSDEKIEANGNAAQGMFTLDLVTIQELNQFYDEHGHWDGEKASKELRDREDSFTKALMQWFQSSVNEAEYASIRLAQSSFRRDQSKFLRIGLFTAVALGIHNMPEGMATYTSYMEEKNFGYGMAFAIAVHNIPEGIAVAVPCFFGTGSWAKALGLCTISAVAEPIGACLAMGIRSWTASALSDGIMFGLISGFMLRVALSELFFCAFRYDPTNIVTIKSMIVGMMIMGFSLVLFEFF